MSSLLNELDDIRNSAVLDEFDDEVDMDETVDAPPPQPQGVRERERERNGGGDECGQQIGGLERGVSWWYVSVEPFGLTWYRVAPLMLPRLLLSSL